MKELINKLLQFFRIKSRIKWTAPAFEIELLEKAYKKTFKPTISCVKNVSNGGEFEVSLTYDNIKKKTKETTKYSVSILKEKRVGLPFKITLPTMLEIGGVKYKESYGLSNELLLEKDGKKYIVGKNSVADFKTNFPAKPQYLNGVFLNFKSSNKESDDTYRRLIIPAKDSELIYPTSVIEYNENHIKFDIPDWDRQKSLIGIPFLSTKGMFAELEVKGIKFHFYALEPINSFVIDSIQKISKKDFVQITQAIRVCFAFLCGKFYKEEIFFLSSDNLDFSNIKNFEYQVGEPSIFTNNQIINPSFFFKQYSESDENKQNAWKDHHNMFPCNLFSSFCEKIIDSPELMRSIELVINAGSIKDSIQKGALYSVSIETITEYLKSTNESAYKPIGNEEKWKQLLESLNEQVTEIKDEIDDSGFQILTKKIENLNSPTNRDKLVKPFELAGIVLTKEELQVLNNRNKYLHGGSPNNSDIQSELDILALKLHSLIGQLILKHIGYTGHLIHLPAWYLIHDDDTKEMIDKVDFKELEEIISKVKQSDLKDEEELEKAKKIIADHKAFLKASLELEQLIKII
jgi:hypothetical protein